MSSLSTGRVTEGNDHPLQQSCMENPMERGAWQAIQSMGVTKSNMTERRDNNSRVYRRSLGQNSTFWELCTPRGPHLGVLCTPGAVGYQELTGIQAWCSAFNSGPLPCEAGIIITPVSLTQRAFII